MVDHLTASRVFVVDDHHLIASTLAAILNMNGFSSRAFSGSLGSLEALAAARVDIPDLLISDVSMSEFSGIELAIRMKAQYPMCKILLLSGHAQAALLVKSARLRGHHFRILAKPIFPTDLLIEIRKIEGEPISQPKGRPKPGLYLVQ
jgi:DNA-binding NtrC family response regulator